MFIYRDNDTLKNELRAEWTRKGLIQKDIARRMGVSTANLSNILVNKKSLSVDDIARICDAMGCDLYIDIREKEVPET